jgi:glycerate dehydrogenase
VITLHCPLTDSNRGFINRNSIAKMKDGVILINTSRGPLIVEEDLAEALKTGKVAAAGLDVLQTEPPEDDHFLFSIPNCIITPHIAWAPIEARARLLKIVIDNILAFLDGKPVNVVN